MTLAEFRTEPQRPYSLALGWTEDRVDQLTRLAFEGLSASQIAAEIGGVSRNAVIGKITRDKIVWNYRRTTALCDKDPDDRKPRKRAPRRKGNLALTFNRPVTMTPEEYVEPTAEPTPDSRMVTLLELRDGWCKYPIDRDGERLFCGAPQWCPENPSDNYCAAHSRLCIQPVRPR